MIQHLTTEFGYMDNFSNNPTSFSGIETVGVGYSSATGGDIELRLTPQIRNNHKGIPV